MIYNMSTSLDLIFKDNKQIMSSILGYRWVGINSSSLLIANNRDEGSLINSSYATQL